MDKLFIHMGGLRQDILSFIVIAIATTPGRVYVPEEVIDMLNRAGWSLNYKEKLRSNSSEDCYYALLSVTSTASSEEIKKAYQKAAMQFHPDRNPGDPTAEGKFISRKEAYDTLKDPASRRAYDIKHGFL